MSSNQSYTRVDTSEIKALIMKRIGNHRADKYFDQLTRLFSLKTTKSEFDKVCVRIIGRENVPLHNQLIRSIIKNACIGKVPPPLKGVKRANVSNGCPRSSPQSLHGDAFPPSPRKGSSRNFKSKDRRSPLGPLSKPYTLSSDDLVSRGQEQSTTPELISLGSRPPVEVASVEEGEEVEQVAGGHHGIQSRSPVTAPLGISVNFEASRKALSNMSVCSKFNMVRETCQNTGELPDTRLLRSRLQQKLQDEGLRVSMDCVDLLNKALDVYLKRLIEPCMGLAGSRSRNGRLQEASGRFVPSFLDVSSSGRFRQGFMESVYGSMLDFRVSVESNPQMLGTEWTEQLEKITLRASEE